MIPAGDRLIVEMPGGGGYGDPLSRDPDAVARDVRLGFVSIDAAQQEYGVVLDAAAQVDVAATESLRRDRAGAVA